MFFIEMGRIFVGTFNLAPAIWMARLLTLMGPAAEVSSGQARLLGADENDGESRTPASGSVMEAESF